MSWQALVQALVLVVLLVATVPLLGRYMADVYGARKDGSAPGDRFFGPVERFIYRCCRIDSKREQRWNVYAVSLLAFSIVSVLVLYALHRLQGSLPFNPTDRPGVSPMGSFNAAISFVTNTNWQWYSGEIVISHFTHMVGNSVQNFVSAAAGMAVVVALIRGITRTNTRSLGNFWVDLVRTLLRILLPLSILFAVVLMSQGVIQNFKGDTIAQAVDQTTEITEQHIPGGPLASQEAIKELGTNGGGFVNANSAHPFANPDGITNVLEIYALLLIPLSFVVAFGRLVRDKKQARTLLAVMVGILVIFTGFAMLAEQNGNPNLSALGVDQSLSVTQSGGNMEGKELRIGAAGCGLFAAPTTGTSTGAVNCMHDSFTPLGGMAPMLHMMLGEISPGGVGVGLMGVLIMALLAVFIAGLMVGRTPEYLGKKIQATEMKLVVLYILAMPFALLDIRGRVGAPDECQYVPTWCARPLRGAVQLCLDGEQQRFGLRLPRHGHPVVHHDTGHLDVDGPVLHDHSRARDRGHPGRQAEGAGDVGHDAHQHPAVRIPRGGCHRHRCRTDLLPGARAGPNPRTSLTVRIVKA